MIPSTHPVRSKPIKHDNRHIQTITVPVNAYSDGNETRWTHLGPAKKCNRDDEYWLNHVGDAVAKTLAESHTIDGEVLGLGNNFSYNSMSVKYVLDRLPDGYAGFRLTTGKQEYVLDGHPRGKSARRIGEVREHLVRLVLGRDMMECKCSLCDGWKTRPTNQPNPQVLASTQDEKATNQKDESKDEKKVEGKEQGNEYGNSSCEPGTMESSRSLNTGSRQNVSLQVDQNGRARIMGFEEKSTTSSNFASPAATVSSAQVPTGDKMDIDNESNFCTTKDGQLDSPQALLQESTNLQTADRHSSVFVSSPASVKLASQQNNTNPHSSIFNDQNSSQPAPAHYDATATGYVPVVFPASRPADVRLPFISQHSLQGYNQNSATINPALLVRDSPFPNMDFDIATGGPPAPHHPLVPNYRQSLSTTGQITNLRTKSFDDTSFMHLQLPSITDGEIANAASRRLAEALSNSAASNNMNLMSIAPDLIVDVENHISIADVVAFADANGFHGPVDFIRAMMVDMHRPGGVRGLSKGGDQI